jgi:hypothetical protein
MDCRRIRSEAKGKAIVERLEYRGYLVRYQFTGTGWFIHWQPMTIRDQAREGHVTATPAEGVPTVLDLTRKAIDAIERERDDFT